MSGTSVVRSTADTGAAQLVRAHAPSSPLRVALIGNPNCGKSTLFNALTGLRQQVANFPGVTVERVEGSYTRGGRRFAVIDLPGAYSLAPESPDEIIAHDVLLGCARGVPPVDIVVLVLDAEQLERNLFLASQVLELGRPTVIALNRVDRLAAAGVSIDVPELIHSLGAVVIPVVATRGEGLEHLRHAIDAAPSLPAPDVRLGVVPRLGDGGRSEAELRYSWVGSVTASCLTRTGRSGTTASDRVDAVVLHRFWGPLIFVGLMALVFQAMFSWARPLTAGVDLAIATMQRGALAVLPAGDVRALLVDGALPGVGSVLVFLPQIAILFLFIALLEDSGYMARAAFVMDRFMRPLGLHGKSFIPLVSGYACAVPAIMGTRTIREPRERLATIMVTPLMSCSARLPVYTLLIGAFVPSVSVLGIASLQGMTLLAMYLLGTLAALATAALFRRTLLRAPTRALILELPAYHWPSARVLATSVWQRVGLFLRRAGTVIFAVSVVLWALAHYPVQGESRSDAARLTHSALGRIGQVVEPAVRPLGYDWKIGVSMISSFAAREVFVTTMATIYGAGASEDGATGTLRERLRAERDVAGRPVYTPLVALGLMVFYVFALMCTSTVAVTVRECGGGWRGIGWGALQFGYMLALAYGAAFLVYHCGRGLGFGGG